MTLGRLRNPAHMMLLIDSYALRITQDAILLVMFILGWAVLESGTAFGKIMRKTGELGRKNEEAKDQGEALVGMGRVVATSSGGRGLARGS
ncbi:hypothetical protein FRC11_003236, partial [Ceratobasidium sp. 423]